MNNVKTHVKTLDGLPANIQQAINSGNFRSRMRCPECGGGRTGELSLSIRRVDNNVIKLSCWRATCGWWATTCATTTKWSKDEFTPREYTLEKHPLEGTDVYDTLCSQYGIDGPQASMRGWSVGQYGELVMPVLDRYGTSLGHSTRTFGNRKFCGIYKTTPAPFLDWYLHPDGGRETLVVVEDQISALRAYCCGLDAVALLGTTITIEMATAIADVCREPYLALDRDAFTKALKLAKRFNHILNFQPICLDADIKNIQTDEEVLSLFGVHYGRNGATGGDMSTETSL